MAITVGKPSSTQANFNISNIIGVDLANSYPVYAIPGSSATQTNLYYPETSNPPFQLGTHVFGQNNSEYVLCVVGTAGSINQYDMVMYDNNYNVLQSSSVIGSVGYQIGFNQNNTPGTLGSVAGIAASQSSVTVNFCWIAIRGDNLLVNTNAAVSINQDMYVGTAAGTIGTASASTILVRGVGAMASVTAATVMSIMAGYPVVGIL